MECVRGMNESGATDCPYCHQRFSTRRLQVDPELSTLLLARFPDGIARRQAGLDSGLDMALMGPCQRVLATEGSLVSRKRNKKIKKNK